MSADAHDHIRARVRGLLISLAAQLPPATVGIVDELLDANEQGIALEILSEMLVESKARISPELMTVFIDIVDEMQLDRVNVERLRPLVTNAEP